jgi:hypothetical protein
LSNTNENDTIPILQNFLELNKTPISFGAPNLKTVDEKSFQTKTRKNQKPADPKLPAPILTASSVVLPAPTLRRGSNS